MAHGITIKASFSLMLVFFTAGCAVIPAPVTVATGSVSTRRPLQIIADGSETELSDKAKVAVRQLLLAQGYRFASDAELGLEIAVADRNANVSFRAPAAQPSLNTIQGDRRSLPLALCQSRIIRLTVSVINLDDGVPAYRGVAESVICGDPNSNDLYILASGAVRSLNSGH